MKKILLCIAIALSMTMLCSAKKTIYLIGDATLASNGVANLNSYGWGGAFAQCMNSQIDVINQAEAGESTHTLVNNKRLVRLVASSKADDIVLLQLGQNDMRNEYNNMYYSTEEMTEKLIEIIKYLEAKDLIIILATPLAQPYYKDSILIDRMGGYPDVIRHVAKLKDVYLLDMHSATFKWLKEIGEEESKRYFTQVPTEATRIEYNLTEIGSVAVCNLAIQELKKRRIRLFNRYLLASVTQ